MKKSKKMNDNDLSISGGKDIFGTVSAAIGAVTCVIVGAAMQHQLDVVGKTKDFMSKWSHS
jgi:hypothetical protein